MAYKMLETFGTSRVMANLIQAKFWCDDDLWVAAKKSMRGGNASEVLRRLLITYMEAAKAVNSAGDRGDVDFGPDPWTATRGVIVRAEIATAIVDLRCVGSASIGQEVDTSNMNFVAFIGDGVLYLTSPPDLSQWVEPMN